MAIDYSPQILAVLKEILKVLKGPDTVIGEYAGWKFEKRGKSVFYNREVTLAGATMNIELPISTAIQLNRIEQYFNSANARSFNVRVYSMVNPAAYVTLDAQTAHTTDSRVNQLGSEFKYRPHKITLEYSAYTVGDKVSIEIQVDEL